MKFSLATRESTRSMLFGISGMGVVVIAYFLFWLPAIRIPVPSLFWGSFPAWIIFGLVMAVRKYRNERNKRNLTWFALSMGILATLLPARFYLPLVNITLAFPGYLVGVCLAGLLSLFRRWKLI